MDPLLDNFATVAVQAVGVLLVAGLLRPLTRLTPGRFLTYWCAAWLVLAGALACLYASPLAGPAAARTPLLAGYCVGEYLFGLLVWAGCRNLTTGRTLLPADWWAAAPLLLPGVAVPVLVSDFRLLFPVHAIFAGGVFVLALLALRPYRPPPGSPTAGLWTVRAALGGLTVLFWHYALVAGYAGYFDRGVVVSYLEYWALYDLFLDTALAFGMMALASDRLRGELEDRNRQLADATAELAQAARTDPLTGLLNRRALDDLTAAPSDARFAGCLAVLDLNDLKVFNDLYGHAAGDAAIRIVARALRAHFRVTDLLYRTGGDEFLIILADGTEADLSGRMARVDAALGGQRLPGVNGAVDVRVAWGVAPFASVADLRPAVHRADSAMYRSKKELKRSSSLHVFKLASPQPAEPTPGPDGVSGPGSRA